MLAVNADLTTSIKLGQRWYSVVFMEQDVGDEYIKWHNFIMTNELHLSEYYVIQITQVKDANPRFMVEYFTGKDRDGCVIGEWTYIDEYFNQEDARKLKELLIQLSDAELRGEFEEEKIFGKDRLGRR